MAGFFFSFWLLMNIDLVKKYKKNADISIPAQS